MSYSLNTTVINATEKHPDDPNPVPDGMSA